jgi:hypothetical protein
LHYAQQNNLAKIVGQPSGGNKQGINGGNYFFLNLPNSKVEIDIPVYFQAPLAPQKDEGVIPLLPHDLQLLRIRVMIELPKRN